MFGCFGEEWKLVTHYHPPTVRTSLSCWGVSFWGVNTSTQWPTGYSDRLDELQCERGQLQISRHGTISIPSLLSAALTSCNFIVVSFLLRD